MKGKQARPIINANDTTVNLLCIVLEAQGIITRLLKLRKILPRKAIVELEKLDALLNGRG